ncbi:hypothetical protein FC826_16330 [Clostridium botulinum]|uniref:Uncharacterized protein n=1 Tax=Clostridium botulinum TaxID=1491 RepID=A0A6B4ZV59_CLOBO|nr:hypothetical protein [Clostridium botulinum]NFD83936.1 hypothetical protein [Clostridium botulinum]NFE07105.1 hypothetical protein [Clostridium botulinum]NFE33961.1 hypothetical protein [Clostridium botulinum]NFE51019.1 hypothetical protein [Clostridium botulinum]
MPFITMINGLFYVKIKKYRKIFKKSIAYLLFSMYNYKTNEE